VLRAAPFWALLKPFQGQDRFGAKLFCFRIFGAFPEPGLFRASCPGPAGAFPEYAPAMRRQLPDDNGQGLLFPHIA